MINFKGLSIIKNSSVNKSAKIKRFNRIYYSNIGSYTYIAPGCIINNCKIGCYCSIAMNVKIGMGSHPLQYISTSPIFYNPNNPLRTKLVKKDLYNEFEKTDIGSDVWIGVNSIIKDGVKISHGAVVGAGSVVTKDVPPYAVVGGVPAKIIKYRFDENIIALMLETKWWEWEMKKIKQSISMFSTDVNLSLIASLNNNK